MGFNGSRMRVKSGSSFPKAAGGDEVPELQMDGNVVNQDLFAVDGWLMFCESGKELTLKMLLTKCYFVST
jgi:hypothetical protein